MKKENLLKKGNESLALGALWGIGSLSVCPCPVCILSTAALILNGVREKISDR